MPTLDEFDFLNTFPYCTLSPMIDFMIGIGPGQNPGMSKGLN